LRPITIQKSETRLTAVGSAFGRPGSETELVDCHADIAPGSPSDIAGAMHRHGGALLEETDQRLPEVAPRGFLGCALAVGAHTRTQLSVSAPEAIFVTLDDDRPRCEALP
jgi:hypothetical protein